MATTTVKEEKKQQQQPAPVQAAELEKVEANQALATIDDEALFGDAGAGLENIGAKDLSVPFYMILQKGSPQVDELNEKFMPDAKPGMIINTVTGELMKELIVVRCGFKSALVRWHDRDSGGGLVGHVHESDPIIRAAKKNAKNQLQVPDSTDIIIDTAYHFVLRLREGLTPEMGVIGMTSTQLKKSRTWNVQIKNIVLHHPKTKQPFTPPSYAFQYKLTTVGESKDKYNWYGWKIEIGERITDPNLFKLAREFSKEVSEDKVGIAAPPQEFNDANSNDDVPF